MCIFVAEIIRAFCLYSNGLHHAVNALDSQDVCYYNFFFFSKLDNVSSPIVSQSLTVTHTLCQELYLNSNQGKSIVSVVFYLKKNDEIASACAQFCYSSLPCSDWTIALVRKSLYVDNCNISCA